MMAELYARGASAAVLVAALCFGTTSATAGDPKAFGWQPVVERGGVPGAGTVETPEDLYSDAQTYINLREWAAADRLLRAIVARFPDSGSAEYARRDIARLRRDVFRFSARSTLGGPVRPPGPRSDPPTGEERPASAAWEFLGQQANLQDQFRSRAGDRLFFAAFSSGLGARNGATLKAQARWLAERPEARVILEAHSDEPGEAVDAVAVAKSRADVVKAALIAEGIQPERISIVVFGRARRVALCELPVCRAQNRRVVVRVTDAGASRDLIRP